MHVCVCTYADLFEHVLCTYVFEATMRIPFFIARQNPCTLVARTKALIAANIDNNGALQKSISVEKTICTQERACKQERKVQQRKLKYTFKMPSFVQRSQKITNRSGTVIVKQIFGGVNILSNHSSTTTRRKSGDYGRFVIISVQIRLTEFRLIKLYLSRFVTFIQ